MVEQLGSNRIILKTNKAKQKAEKKRQEEYTGIDSDHGRNASEHWKSSAALGGIPSAKSSTPMIITSWNIRGLNSKGKQRHLTDRPRKEKPQLMLVQETKIS